jgi:transposase InsO family protein
MTTGLWAIKDDKDARTSGKNIALDEHVPAGPHKDGLVELCAVSTGPLAFRCSIGVEKSQRRLAPRGVSDFTVPTATFRVLFVLIVLAHHRRRLIHFNVTENPTAAWTGQQIVEAFPEDTIPPYLIRDRDRIYGDDSRSRVGGLGIQEVMIAPQSPWQNPFAERLVGSIRRECLDHVIVLGQRHLRKILQSYFDYYLQSRTHLSLAKDAPASRRVQPPELGKVVELPQVGGLHHRYERRAA